MVSPQCTFLSPLYTSVYSMRLLKHRFNSDSSPPKSPKATERASTTVTAVEQRNPHKWTVSSRGGEETGCILYSVKHSTNVTITIEYDFYTLVWMLLLCWRCLSYEPNMAIHMTMCLAFSLCLPFYCSTEYCYL